ncbi:MAG: MFS transporter [Candidatus Eisenbacteria bacterium]|nr:MFS transporter [Candidatus Eisenbacteria bacterium]
MPGDRTHALRFVVLLGFVSLFADMTYEAARSINGPFLAILGASGAAVGIVAGLGELIGHGLRIVSGHISDRTKRYWTITILGYSVNLLAVPALALAGRWETAAFLMMIERLGKAVRAPARDAMLSHATHSMGRGLGFGLHEMMDQIGAMAGPLLVTAIFAMGGSYRGAYAILLVPALLALLVLVLGRAAYPHPSKLEKPPSEPKGGGVSRLFWLYLAAIALVAAAFADFPLIAFHLKSKAVLEDKWIPLLYAFAMGVDAIAAIFFGRWFDRKGMLSLILAVAVASLFALFAFSLRPWAVVLGMALWGIGMGAQESIVRAAVADFVPRERRATGYGIFHTGFGVAWFLGSATMGVLYDRSIPALVVFSIVLQFLSLPLLARVHRMRSARP